MKANEMPERIYIFDYNDAMVTPIEGDTVYVRKDAFIEKAVNFLNCSLSGIVAIKNGNTTQGLLRTKSEFIALFKKYMEGE